MGTLASSISGGDDKGTCQVKGDCSMSDTPRSKTIVCEEVFHEDSIPSEEEVIDYAKKIGIDPEGERHLLPIALNGLMQPLPEGWKPCFDITLKRWYYYNEQTKTSQWEHPLDNVYRNLVKRGRSEGYSSAADDDSKITREDLKSFEEVSDLLSSKSNDTKPDKLADMNELDRKDGHPRAHQPLLLRRKQLQHNPQFSPLQVAKMINNTMRENIEERGFKNVVTENRTFRVSPAKVGDSLTRYPSSNSLPKESGNKSLQPLRRAQTLDPIPTFISTNPKADPPIKGILRESSFSGLSNRNLSRLNPIQGESPTSHEVDDEKKRSVRFADFERKSLDIKFQLSSDGSTSEEASGSSSEKEGKPKGEAEKFMDELNGFKKSLNAVENARNRINEKIVNTQASTKPLAINNLSDEDSASISKDANLQSLTDQVSLKNSPKKITVNCQKPIDPEILSLRDAIKSIVGLEEESNSNIAQYEEKIAKEISEKINQLQIQKIEKINKIKADLIKEEDAEKQKLAEESANKLNELKRKLNIEMEKKEKEIRDGHNKEVNEVMERLKNEKSNRLAAIMADLKTEEDKLITDEKNKGLLRIEEVKSFFEAQTKESEEKFENEVKRLENVYAQKIESLKIEKETELKRIQTEWDDKITANSIQNKSILDSALADHERNMASLKQQFQKEEEALKLSHAQQVEAWNHKLKKLNDKEPNSLTPNRDFEKMRCEKRLIEDKYRSLKDKYLQLKTDIEIAVERKLQNRSRKKKEEHKDELKENPDEKGSNEAKNKGKNNNPEVLVNDEKAKGNKTKLNPDQLPKEGVENDLSDDQYTSLSLTLPNEEKSLSVSPNRGNNSLEKKKLSRGKLRLEHGQDRQGNVLDDIRTQLQELEEIEEQIPANSQGDTYLRYPFHGQGLSTSAEVDFYRHRVIVEQEAVRAARECLIQQKRELDARQNFLRTNNNSTMQQLQQQERDLTEMEVSLYRTKALLGEKMIRLRLLGQTLNRIIEDCPNAQNNTNALKDNLITPTAISPGNFAFSGENVPLNMLQNLENIYSEIGEIQSQINKQQIDGIAEPAMDNLYLKLPPSMPLNKPMRRVPSNRIEIETRLKDIQEWLHKTTPNQH